MRLSSTKAITIFLTAAFCFLFVGYANGQSPWESDKRVSELPGLVKSFLKTAEEFTIRMEAVRVNGKLVAAMDRVYTPNRSAVFKDAALRTEFLEKFLFASTSELMGAICYAPSHSIEAKDGEKFVNIEICFGCRKYIVTGSFGNFYGTIAGEQESEAAFNDLLLPFDVE